MMVPLWFVLQIVTAFSGLLIWNGVARVKEKPTAEIASDPLAVMISVENCE